MARPLQVISGRHQATLYLCTPDLLRGITPRLGRVLGPRGLMPSARRGTVTLNVAGYIRSLQGSTQWIGDKAGTIRAAIGRVSTSRVTLVQVVELISATGGLFCG